MSDKFFKEGSKSPEAEKKSKIILQFLRHGKREKGKTLEEDASNNLRLTKEGRAQIDKKRKDLKPQAEVSLAWGSPRLRTHETAYRAMLEQIGPDDTLEEIEKKVSEELKEGEKGGKKIIVDERLNFQSGGPIGKEADEAYYAGRYLPYLVDESDKRAVEMGDAVTSTYTRNSANVAEIVKRYLSVSRNFNQIVSRTDKYEKFGNQLERYLGTHQAVSESFAAKIIEKVEGSGARQEFLDAVGGGFKEGEGVRVEIENSGGQEKIFLKYKIGEEGKTVELTEAVIDEIIREREEFEKAVLEHSQ